MNPLTPGHYALFRGSWGLIVLVGQTFVFLEKWRGQRATTAPIDEIVDVKTDERLRWDERHQLGRRLTDF